MNLYTYDDVEKLQIRYNKLLWEHEDEYTIDEMENILRQIHKIDSYLLKSGYYDRGFGRNSK